MKWQAKKMLDPGDGIVSKVEFEHESDDIVDVARDVLDGSSELGEFHGWLFGLEALP